MFRQHIQWQSTWVDSTLLVVLGLALMGWLSPQVWTFQGTLPITPQSLIVVLWGVLWGWQVGTAAVALYLVSGGLGAPVFADGDPSGPGRHTGRPPGPSGAWGGQEPAASLAGDAPCGARGNMPRTVGPPYVVDEYAASAAAGDFFAAAASDF